MSLSTHTDNNKKRKRESNKANQQSPNNSSKKARKEKKTMTEEEKTKKQQQQKQARIYVKSAPIQEPIALANNREINWLGCCQQFAENSVTVVLNVLSSDKPKRQKREVADDMKDDGEDEENQDDAKSELEVVQSKLLCAIAHYPEYLHCAASSSANDGTVPSYPVYPPADNDDATDSDDKKEEEKEARIRGMAQQSNCGMHPKGSPRKSISNPATITRKPLLARFFVT